MDDECVEALGRPISSLKVAELRDELTKRALTKSGNKKELIDRLRGAILRNSSNQSSQIIQQQQQQQLLLPQQQQQQQQQHHHHMQDNLQQSNQAIDTVIANQQQQYMQQIEHLQQAQQLPPYSIPPLTYDLQQQQQQLHQAMMAQPLDLQQHPQQLHYVTQSSIEAQQLQLNEAISSQPPIDMRVHQEVNLVPAPQQSDSNIEGKNGPETTSPIKEAQPIVSDKSASNYDGGNQPVEQAPSQRPAETLNEPQPKPTDIPNDEPDANMQTKIESSTGKPDLKQQPSSVVETDNSTDETSKYYHENNDDISQQISKEQSDLSLNQNNIIQSSDEHSNQPAHTDNNCSQKESNLNESSSMIENIGRIPADTTAATTVTGTTGATTDTHSTDLLPKEESNGAELKDKGEVSDSSRKDKKRRWSSKTTTTSKTNDHCNEQLKQQSNVLNRGLSSQKLLELIPDFDSNTVAKQSTKTEETPPTEVKSESSLADLIGTESEMNDDLLNVTEKTTEVVESVSDSSKAATIQPNDKGDSMEDGSNKTKQDATDEISTDRPPSPAKNEPSNVLFIQNLVRPFTLGQLKDVLTKHGSLVDGRFWTDKVKSKCCVQYETLEIAKISREFLHGQKWPSSNPKTLAVDYSTIETLDEFLLADKPKPVTEVAERQVGDATNPDDAKDESESKNVTGKTAMADRLGGKLEDTSIEGKPNSDTTKSSKDSLRNRLGERVGKDDTNQKRKQSSRSPESLKRSRNDNGQPDNEENGKQSTVKMLDDLFRKTKASPSIFWLPLSEEQVVERERYREEMRKKREQKHLSSGPGDVRSRDDRNASGPKKTQTGVSKRRGSPSPRRRISTSARRSRSPRRPRRPPPPSKTVHRSSSEVSSGSSSRSRSPRRGRSPPRKSKSRSVSRTPKFRQSHSVRSPMRSRPSRSPPSRNIPRNRGSPAGRDRPGSRSPKPRSPRDGPISRSPKPRSPRDRANRGRSPQRSRSPPPQYNRDTRGFRQISPIQTSRNQQTFNPNRREPQGYQSRLSPPRQQWMNRPQQSPYPRTGPLLLGNRGGGAPQMITRPLLPRRLSRSRSRERNEERFRGPRPRPLYQ